MNLKPASQSLFILCSLLLMAVTIACGNLNQSNKDNQPVQVKHDNRWLTFTSGVRVILEDSKGNTWFGSDNEGVCLLHNGEFRYFTTANGLTNNQVRCIYEDINGITWFECGNGLSTYDGQKMSVYKERNYDAVNQWKVSAGDLWFKGDELAGNYLLEKGPGVYQYDGNKLSFRRFPVTQASDNERSFRYAISTHFVKSKNGTIWFGTYKTLFGYNGSAFRIITDEDLAQQGVSGTLHVRDIMEDSKGNLWIANNGSGVFKYDGKEIINFTAQHKLKKEDTNGNSLERAFSIGEDRAGNMWFGTVGSGAWKYDGTTVTNFSKEDGLESDHIWSIYTTKQRAVWLAGARPSGVYQFNGKSFERIY